MNTFLHSSFVVIDHILYTKCETKKGKPPFNVSYSYRSRHNAILFYFQVYSAYLTYCKSNLNPL